MYLRYLFVSLQNYTTCINKSTILKCLFTKIIYIRQKIKMKLLFLLGISFLYCIFIFIYPSLLYYLKNDLVTYIYAVYISGIIKNYVMNGPK